MPKEGALMVMEARLESVASGLAPVTPGWFVVNAADAAWTNNHRHGGVCIFESDEFVLRGRPDLTAYEKPAAGFVIRVVSPGQPTGGLHAESVEEDFLVIAGECILLIEDEERHLRTWDFVHCPPGTAHAFVGAGEGLCIIVCAGNRDFGETFWREDRDSEAARRYGASGDQPRSEWRVERPATWAELPWS
jgi:uncharacterized cupin superfamily protein